MVLKVISFLSRTMPDKQRTEAAHEVYAFGPFRLDPGERLLLRNSEPVSLTPKAFDLLLALVEQPGRLLEKEVLLRKVWPDTFVEENNLADNISRLRKALGEDERGQKLIETVPKRGYRFVAEVRRMAGNVEHFPNHLSERTRRSWRAPIVAGLAAAATVAAGFWLYGLLAQRSEVQQLVFQGDFYTARWTEPEIRKAMEYYNRALALNPGESGAYAGLATAWIFLADVYTPPRVAMPKAKAAALRAMEAGGESAQNHVSLGVVSMQYDWDAKRAEAHFQRAIQLDPDHMPGHGLYGWYLMGVGRMNEAVEEMKRALDKDPANDFGLWELGLACYFARRVDEAVEQYRRAIAIEPRSHWSHMLLGWALAEKGRFEEAISEVNQALRLDENPQVLASLGYVYARAGQRQDAQRVLSQLQQTASRRYVSPYDLAPVYAALGDHEQALKSLERAYEDRSGWLAWWLRGDPRFDRLRSDGRFEDLLRRIGPTPQ